MRYERNRYPFRLRSTPESGGFHGSAARIGVHESRRRGSLQMTEQDETNRSGSDPVVVITRRGMRRLAAAVVALLVLAGVGVGFYFVGRSSVPSKEAAASTPTSTAPTARSDDQIFAVPSTAMYPTIKAGDRIVVNKLAYEDHGIHRGDIVLLKAPPAEQSRCGGQAVTDLVKRVIGLPGNSISAHNGRVYVTGKLLQEPWLPNVSTAYTTDFGPEKVPPGDYFVMGDDRKISCDSRSWGPVNRSYIVGKVVQIIAVTSTTAPQPSTTTSPATTPSIPKVGLWVPVLGKGPQYEPGSLSSDPACASQSVTIRTIHWTSWTTSQATGTGTWVAPTRPTGLPTAPCATGGWRVQGTKTVTLSNAASVTCTQPGGYPRTLLFTTSTPPGLVPPATYCPSG